MLALTAITQKRLDGIPTRFGRFKEKAIEKHAPRSRFGKRASKSSLKLAI
jgi:hypothetical protein